MAWKSRLFAHSNSSPDYGVAEPKVEIAKSLRPAREYSTALNGSGAGLTDEDEVPAVAETAIACPV
jgi:hypothetical protein